MYRAFLQKDKPGEKRRTFIDIGGFTGFDNAFEMPTLKEGFKEIGQVSFVFEGDEENRRRYSMWLEIGVQGTRELESKLAP